MEHYSKDNKSWKR